jgi:hypothetical protein
LRELRGRERHGVLEQRRIQLDEQLPGHDLRVEIGVELPDDPGHLRAHRRRDDRLKRARRRDSLRDVRAHHPHRAERRDRRSAA